jgi:lysophospholipase L1-like esterase
MIRSALALAVLCLASAAAPAQETARPVLRKGARVAVVGDSITEQKLYSKYVELYLLACVPELDLKVIQLGWSGETAPGFAARMENDLLPWKPDVVTTGYGMNDGGYRPFADATGQRYENAMRDIVQRLKKSGATVVVGSPGAVDRRFFRKGAEDAKMYNDTLGKLRDVARKLAEAEGQPFADVFAPMIAAVEKAKPVLGEEYDVCGKDGFHPGPNGHLVMAYAFLRGLGVDGKIGTITLDAAKGEAAASEGHRVLSAGPGKVELESARWPFCFSGDEKSSAGTRSITPFVPFNEDLNRLTLVVKGLAAEKAKVTWGEATKTFPRADLEKGINLAAEFPENPFGAAFRKLDGLVAAKQAFETPMIKTTINSFPRVSQAAGKSKDVDAELEGLRKQLFATQEALHRAARAAVVPVRHAIAVE